MKRSTPKPTVRNKPGRPPGAKNKDQHEITLNNKEQLFADLICEQLLRTKKERLSNGMCYSKAYPGVKQSSANALSSLLLKTPRIHDYIQARKKAAAKRTELKVSKVIEGLLRIATFDHRKLLTEKGRVISNFKNIDDATAMAISGLDFENIVVKISRNKQTIRQRVKTIKTESRLRAWELLGQYLKMFDGQGTAKSPQEYVDDMREFANIVAAGVPGGKL